MNNRNWNLAHVPASGQYSIQNDKASVLSIVESEGMLSPVVFLKDDAHLISAAPDLLEALEDLFQSYKSLADRGDAGNWKIEDFPEGKKALAAIAKAKGNQYLSKVIL